MTSLLESLWLLASGAVIWTDYRPTMGSLPADQLEAMIAVRDAWSERAESHGWVYS